MSTKGHRVKVVFLHGIGDGEPEREWFDALNRALAAAGHPPIDDSQVIAPRYDSFLEMDGLSADMPDVTYKPKDEPSSRRKFEQQQAAVQRLLQQEPGVTIFGFNRVPEPVMAAAHAFGANNLPVMNLDHVRRYVDSEPHRGAILRNILDDLPTRGEIVLIGHSLGTVVAIDLLDHLPKDLKVRRFITLGSPANSNALHRGSERLLKKFPYSQVDDWTNFFDPRDVVTMGRGLASVFPGAQDFAIAIGGPIGWHAAQYYIGHAAVVRLIAEVLYPTKHVVRANSDITVRLTDEQFFSLVKLHFAQATAGYIKDSAQKQRYMDACNVIQDDVAAQLQQLADAGHPLPSELWSIIAGHLPPLPQRLELREAVTVLTSLTATNFVEPYEIDVGYASKDALGDMLLKLGFSHGRSTHIVTALNEVDKLLKRSGGIPWGRIGVAAAGLALLAAGPVGLMVAAPASAFGAAAITGGLAAFGPGGMVGGIATLGTLAATGAGMAAGAAMSDGSPEVVTVSVTQLTLRVAADYALKLLELPVDTELWGQLVTLETQISAQLNRLETFSNPKAFRVDQLRAAKGTVTKLLGFVVDKGLGGANSITAAAAG
jgi:pimeloyl-ACP methyl ester carboxylesterase